MTAPTVQILLVEDHRPDIVLTQKAFERSTFNCQLHIVRDGEEAWSFLTRQSPFSNAPFPDLVLLDINLPRKSGIEVLKQIRSNANLANITVIVLSSSSADSDVKKCYEKKANSFFTKPTTLSQFYEMIRQIEQIWLNAPKLNK